MSVSSIIGTRSHLKPWAMIQAKRFAVERNKTLDVGEDPIEVDELAFTGGRDEGTFVVWEVQDGAGWIITVSADFTTGQVTVEA